MKVLLDENLPHKLLRALGERDVVTVGYMGWNGLKNGELLQIAEESGISVLLTGDRSLRYEQSVVGKSIAVVVLSAHEWPEMRKHLMQIESAVDNAKPGSFTEVACGNFTRSRRTSAP